VAVPIIIIMDINALLIEAIQKALESAGKEFNLTNIPSVTLAPTPKKEFGDLSTNIAMQVCKLNTGCKPEVVASYMCDLLKENAARGTLAGQIEQVCVKPPAFINFFFSNKAVYDVISQIEKQKDAFGKISQPGKGKKVIVEFVSANPTGPLTVAHARQAVVGGAICNVLEFFGWKVTREYYVNDEGAQIDLLGDSIYARYAEFLGKKIEIPENGYQGDYIKDIAQQLYKKYGDRFKDIAPKDRKIFSDYGMDCVMKEIKKDLADIHVVFDNYTAQHKLTSSDKVKAALELLKKKGFVYEKEGAVWFKSTEFKDDKDRVLIKNDGSYTYLAPDIAYHKEKYDKGFDRLIDLWGPDHHGYVARMKAAQKALGHIDTSLDILIVQLVSVYRDGVLVRMSKRSGDFITLREVIDEVGPDVAKFFFLTRKMNSHLDFDLELAKKQSLENPVYYIQYAHARICGILEHNKTKDQVELKGADPSLLKEEEELALLKKLREYPEILSSAYEALEPYRITDYLLELASQFHSFYTKHKVVSESVQLTQARLVLVSCVKVVISNALGLLGISQPEKM